MRAHATKTENPLLMPVCRNLGFAVSLHSAAPVDYVRNRISRCSQQAVMHALTAHSVANMFHTNRRTARIMKPKLQTTIIYCAGYCETFHLVFTSIYALLVCCCHSRCCRLSASALRRNVIQGPFTVLVALRSLSDSNTSCRRIADNRMPRVMAQTMVVTCREFTSHRPERTVAAASTPILTAGIRKDNRAV